MFFALLFNFHSYFLYSFVASEEQSLKSDDAALFLKKNPETIRQKICCVQQQWRTFNESFVTRNSQKTYFSLSFWHPCCANPPFQPTRSLQICNQKAISKKKKKVFCFVAVLQLMGLCKTAKTGKKWTQSYQDLLVSHFAHSNPHLAYAGKISFQGCVFKK